MRILLAIVLFASVAFCAANPFSIHDKIHQVRQSGEPLNNMIRAHLERSSEFTPLQTINEAVRFAAQSNFHTQDLSACRAAVSALNNATLECNLAEILQGYINPMNLLNSSLTTFCQSNCTGKLENVLGRVNRTCKNFVSIDTGVAGFQDALVAAKTGCMQDTEGLYCLRAYRRVANATQAFSTNTLAADQLESACRSPCIQQQFSAITEYGRGQIVATMGFYKTMCSQINGEFCALTYQSFQQASSNNPNATVQQDQVCQPCFRRFLTGTFEMLSVAAVNTTTTAGSLTSAVNSLSYLCSKDQNGAYCSQRINDQPPQIQSCAQILISNVTGVPTTCPANCTQDMTLAINNLGCCMNTVFKLLVAQNSIPSDFTVDKINGLLQNSCNISLPGGCVSGQVNMTLAMRNVKSAFVVSDWATIKTALQNDLSGRLGVARDAIQVLGYSLNFTDAPVQPPVTPNNTNQTQQAMHPRARFYLRVDANNSTNGTQGNNTNPQPPVVTPNTTVDTGLPGFRAFLSIVPPAQDELDLIFNELTAALPARDLDLAHLGSSIPLLSRVDPMQGLEVEPAYSSVTGPSTDTLATFPAPRAATVAVAALVLSGMVHLLASSL